MTTISRRRPTGLDLDLLTTDRVAFARIAGTLDDQAAPGLVQTFERLLATGSRDVLLDCAGLAFCDSSGLRALVTIRNAQPEGATFTLVRLRPPVRRLLEVTGLADTFVLA